MHKSSFDIWDYDRLLKIYPTAVIVGGMGFHITEILAMGGQESFVLLMKVRLLQLPPSISINHHHHHHLHHHTGY